MRSPEPRWVQGDCFNLRSQFVTLDGFYIRSGYGVAHAGTGVPSVPGSFFEPGLEVPGTGIHKKGGVSETMFVYLAL